MKIKFRDRNCPVCAGGSIKKVFAESNFDFSRLNKFAFASRKIPEYMHYRLVECKGCDLLYSNPIPETAALNQLYHQSDFDSTEEASFASATYGKMLTAIKSELPDLNGALDVGTGTGSFLQELNESGFKNVIGVEPSIQAIEAAAPEIKAQIQTGIFNKNNFAANSLSLISCFQTLEHLPDPGHFCADAATLLRPGGAVYFVMHDRRAWSAKLLRTKSPIFDIEHLQLFCRDSAMRLLKENGFERVRVKPIVNRYPLYYWCRLFPFPAKFKALLVRALRTRPFRNIKISLSAGNFAIYGFKV